MNLNNLQDIPCALVTGGARRIGAAIVKRLHQSGYNVLIHCHHSQQAAEALSIGLNHIRKMSAKIVICDLTQDDAVTTLIQALGDWQARLHVLVNNASCFWRSDLKSVDFKSQLENYRVNVLQPLALSIGLKSALAQNRGCIVNITDVHAEKPLKGYLEYCQTKAALLMQTKGLAREFAPDVRINAVAPGAIAWPEGANTLSHAAKEQIVQRTLMKKHGEPEDIASAVLFLVQNGFITGEVIHVDGGRSV